MLIEYIFSQLSCACNSYTRFLVFPRQKIGTLPLHSFGIPLYPNCFVTGIYGLSLELRRLGQKLENLLNQHHCLEESFYY